MLGVTIIALTVVLEAHTNDSLSKFMDKLLDRKLQVWSLHQTVFDDTTLCKSGYLTVPSKSLATSYMKSYTIPSAWRSIASGTQLIRSKDRSFNVIDLNRRYFATQARVLSLSSQPELEPGTWEEALPSYALGLASAAGRKAARRQKKEIAKTARKAKGNKAKVSRRLQKVTTKGDEEMEKIERELEAGRGLGRTRKERALAKAARASASGNRGRSKAGAVAKAARASASDNPGAANLPNLSSTSFLPIRPRVSLAFHAAAATGLRRTTKASNEALSATAAPAKMNVKVKSVKSNPQSIGDGGTLVWLRSFDLRLHDHPVFSHASQRRLPVHVVYAWSDQEDKAQGEWALGGTAAAFWLNHALASLNNSLQLKYGINIAMLHGESTTTALLRAVNESGVDKVVTSKSFEPAGRMTEAKVRTALERVSVCFESFNSFLLHDIDEVRVDMGNYRGHFGTLMPFYIACNKGAGLSKPVQEPAVLVKPRRPLSGDSSDALGFTGMPVRSDGTVVDWGGEILRHWKISEAEALNKLYQFLEPRGGLSRYEKQRNLADASAVARLSPYLRFGMLSARLMMHELNAVNGKDQSVTFFRRLTWRDLAYWQLKLFPAMQTEPIRAHYVGQLWNQDSQALLRWQQGRTGYPLVDAGMRELWATGWMCQNVRMAAAAFLCEVLNIHWKEGEKWFHHCLVDGDPAINAMMWQNAGKSGLDQWNFFVHPVTSGKTQDPWGNYVRRWLPELKGLPTKYIHEPWMAPPQVLAEAGVTLGPHGNYPERIVEDLKEAARASGDAIRAVRSRSLQWNDQNGYDVIVLPHGATKAHDGKPMRIFTVKQYRLKANGEPAEGPATSRPGRSARKQRSAKR